jgi:WD40 repeat protein
MSKSPWLPCILGVLLLGVGLYCAEGQERSGREPKLRAKLREHAGAAYSLSFSPDGKTLASGSRDGTVKLWDVASGKLAATLQGHPGSVWALAFSPDGRVLVAGSGRFDPKRQQYVSGELKVWDVAKRHLKETVEGHAKMVNAVAFSPNGKLLVSASDDSSVKLWNVAEGTLRPRQVVYDGRAIPAELRKRGPDAVGSVEFSPDAKLLAWGDNDFAVVLWNVATGQERARLEGHAGGIRSVTFSPDGRTLASAGFDWTRGGVSITLWEVLTAKKRAGLDFTYKQTSGIHTLAFGGAGRKLAWGNNDGVVKLWDLAPDRLTSVLEDKNISVYSLKFNPDQTVLAAGRSDGSVAM